MKYSQRIILITKVLLDKTIPELVGETLSTRVDPTNMTTKTQSDPSIPPLVHVVDESTDVVWRGL